MQLPDWIKKHKEPRTDIRKIGNGFYKYEVAFVYSKTKKRTEKKTIRLLGKITEKDGFIPSSKDALRRISEELPKVDIKTFGLYHLFSDLMKEEIASLKKAFGDEQSERLLSFAMMRWAYQTPIKRATYYHSHDFCSQYWATKNMSDKTVSLNLKWFGENREKTVGWMKSLLSDVPENEQNFVLMDSTHAVSVSENLSVNAKGYNPDFDFDKQIRLMYLFSAQMKQPVYYRLINGNITDVKSMTLCVKEMNVKDKVVFIADKGFFSAENVAMMEEEIEIPKEKNTAQKTKKKKTEPEKPLEQTVYESYRQRGEIETMFDSFKNYLDADVSYMQNRYVLEGWLFANFIAMIAYYKLYVRLRQAEILSKHSPKDIIEQSKAIHQIKIRNLWYRTEITEKTQRLFAKIGIDYLK